ncbi:MAG: hypothetical protein HC828_04740 [Blastochloris sp.]|nr:hypothetical protein [Blastochloris sp.]
MSTPALHATIVRELGRMRSREDVIRLLCEQHGLQWSEAEQLVQQVASGSTQAVARQQRPFMLLFVLGGVLLVGAILVRVVLVAMPGWSFAAAPTSITETREQLVGTWRLRESVVILPDGTEMAQRIPTTVAEFFAEGNFRFSIQGFGRRSGNYLVTAPDELHMQYIGAQGAQTNLVIADVDLRGDQLRITWQAEGGADAPTITERYERAP